MKDPVELFMDFIGTLFMAGVDLAVTIVIFFKGAPEDEKDKE